MTADPNPHAIALVGDIHGKPAAFEHTLATALNRGVTSIVQVGDFWIYDAPKEPAKLERIIARVCRDANVDADLVDYRFIDGNHESFDYLTPDIADPVRISEHVTYMPRGTRAKLADAELLFFGGASSADKQYRTEGKTRWPAENITDDQLARGLAAARTRPVDVLVTHETTTAVFADLCALGGHALDKVDDPPGGTNRAKLDQLVAVAHPRALVHGHHHTRHASTHAGVQVISLSLETSVGSVAILDTDSWTWRVPSGRRDTGDDVILWNGAAA
jgi:predicted phosphodiesterase